LLPLLHPIPEIPGDDAQLRDLLHDPAVRVIEAGDALARGRVFHVPQPVPHQPADIEFVVQNAGAAVGIAVNGRGVPLAASGPGNAVLVQVDGNPPGRLAGGELGEDPAHDCRCRLINHSAAMDRLAATVELANHVIAEAQPAARSSLAHPAFEATPGLIGEILQEEGVHRALQPDMQFADLALGHRDQPHAGEAQALQQPGNVLLVARQPVQGLGDDYIELTAPDIFEQRLIDRKSVV